MPKEVSSAGIEDQLADLIRLDAAVHFATCGTIRTKQAKVLTGPKPNILQKRVFDHYRRCQKAGKACKIIILKPRQTGASTVNQHLMYYHLQRYPGTNAAVMGDIAGTSDKVFDLYRRFAEHDPFVWFEGEPLKQNLADQIELANGSRYTKTTAGSKNAGRSGTVQAGNLTEPAFYRTEGGSDPTLAFLNSAYDGGPECLYTADSTPNGPQGWFYQTCMASLQNSTDWHLVFAAWFEFEDHRKPFHTDGQRREFEESLTPDERREMELYECDLEQMNWRRSTIADKCGGEVAKFRQEYPSDIHECFLLSSRPRFNTEQLGRLRKACRDVRPEVINLMPQEDGSIAAQPDVQGQWEMWERPAYHKRYLIGVDVCTGEDQQMERGLAPDPDYHSAQVWRDGYFDDLGVWHLPRLVAAHHSRLEISYLAAEVAAASRFYGNCLIVPEVNGPGLALVKLLRELHSAPVYRRRKVNDSSGLVEKAFGWSTDILTRKTVIDWFSKLVTDAALDIPDPKLLEEMSTFITNRKGKPEAAQGLHDDRVLAAAIALFNLRHAKEHIAPRRKTLSARLLDENPSIMCPDGFMRKPLKEVRKRNGRGRALFNTNR